MGKNKLKPFTDSKNYVEFKKSRDHALEKILHVHLSAIDLVIHKLKSKISNLVHNSRALTSFRVSSTGPIKMELMLASVQVSEIVKRLRGETYLLAHAGETEAMARATGKPYRTHAKVKAYKDKETPSGGSVDDRILLSFERLARSIQDAVQLSFVRGDDVPTTLKRVMKSFPPTRHMSKTPGLSKRKLKLVKQSDYGDVTDYTPSVSITDDNLWDEILEDYRATTLPSDIFQRGPNDTTMFYDIQDTDPELAATRYTWEVEQEITEDFVKSVRDGTIDSAKEAGIQDFMWIAVLDAHTDECCEVRDGLSSSEIEKKITDGSIDGEECDAIVAPAHFNCRCDVAPMTDDLPETEPSGLDDFNDWLEGNANDQET